MRILALDHGSARCGCAISDPSGTLATPLDVVERPDTKRGLAALARLVGGAGRGACRGGASADAQWRGGAPGRGGPDVCRAARAESLGTGGASRRAPNNAARGAHRGRGRRRLARRRSPAGELPRPQPSGHPRVSPGRTPEEREAARLEREARRAAREGRPPPAAAAPGAAATRGADRHRPTQPPAAPPRAEPHARRDATREPPRAEPPEGRASRALRRTAPRGAARDAACRARAARRGHGHHAQRSPPDETSEQALPEADGDRRDWLAEARRLTRVGRWRRARPRRPGRPAHGPRTARARAADRARGARADPGGHRLVRWSRCSSRSRATATASP